MQQFFRNYPEKKLLDVQSEQRLLEQVRAAKSNLGKSQRGQTGVNLAVVVHIIHNNGPENISDAQVLKGIQDLNLAFANTGYYDPADGVNTGIQFCMAQRDPLNQPTNGITRDVSPYTVMGGTNYYSDDQNVKNINRWNPRCYVNIWLVNSIPTSVVGYAYMPSAHGMPMDGIIIEAGYFGTSYANDVVVAHEVGHYLGLFHTFEGGCSNTDCSIDGDRVCDTPPDQSTAGISCSSSVNSCSTDVLSGFATDQNDLTQDYMDYGNFNCMKVFTQGQADRMNWFIQNVRYSLLACKSCLIPCPAPVTAAFTAPASTVLAGTGYTFSNTSTNASSYSWYINNVLQGSAANLSFSFPAPGNYQIKLVAHSGNTLCDDDSISVNLTVTCSAAAGFTHSAATVAAGTPVVFTNTSTGADAFEWRVNGSLQSSSTNFSYTSTAAGTYYIQLDAISTAGHCRSTAYDTVTITCPVTVSVTPATATITQNNSLSFSGSGSGISSWQWTVNGMPVGNTSAISQTFTTPGIYHIVLEAGNGTCSSTATATVYVTDKCGNGIFYFRNLYKAGAGNLAKDIKTTGDGGAILAGQFSPDGGPFSNASLLKLDAGGTAQWMYRYGTTTNSNFKRVYTTSDGGYIAIGAIQAATTQGSLKTFIVKTDASGNIGWARDYSLPGTFSMEGNDIKQAGDGSYYATGTLYQPGSNGSSDVWVAKLDGSGNVSWWNIYDARSSETGNGISIDNGSLVVTGNKPGLQSNNGFLLKIDASSGIVTWAYGYATAADNFTDVTTVAGGYFINAFRATSPFASASTDHAFLMTDVNGIPRYSCYIRPFPPATAVGYGSALPQPDGTILSVTSSAVSGNYADFVLTKTNPATGVQWAKTYNDPDSRPAAIAQNAAREIWLGGFSLAGGPQQTYAVKADSSGQTGNCPSQPAHPEFFRIDYQIQPVNYTLNKAQPQSGSNPLAVPVTINALSLCSFNTCDSTLTPKDTCKLCSSLAVKGIDRACVNTTANYTFVKDTGCPAAIQMLLSDTSIATLVQLTDSTVQLQFRQQGVVQLIGRLKMSCGIVSDTITIHSLISPGTVNLGPDQSICSFSAIALHAGKGFKEYLWDDGSVDSVLTAYNPGTYYVTAKNYCGQVFSDTIHLTLLPTPPFDLGPDLQKCLNDTLTINAPGSYASYTWAAAYNISSTNNQSIRVWPTVDTMYTVVATIANGCSVLDSIRVRVTPAPVVKLGPDTSFCEGAILQLKAPAGYSSYLWQDGSTGMSFNVSAAGAYWVKVSAANGCTGTDTLNIINVYPKPGNILDSTASICGGKTVTLSSSQNWSTYLWSNNSSSSSITINSPGAYWLKVTNSFGCIGTDTIIVAPGSNCGTGIWFPNAFTPDHNGNNDTYKPVCFSIPVQYHLYIYNRYGEKVFETSDYTQGWDGFFRGSKQAAGGFVWWCRYQLSGLTPVIAKGNLILVR
jgi:gliding motility-associated-like protein